jgi:hypothetical protein
MAAADEILLEIFEQLRNPIRDRNPLPDYLGNRIYKEDDILIQKIVDKPFYNHKILLNSKFQFNYEPKKPTLELCLQALASLEPNEILKAFLKILNQWKDQKKDEQSTHALVKMCDLLVTIPSRGAANSIFLISESMFPHQFKEDYLIQIHTLLAHRLTANKDFGSISRLSELAPPIYLESLLRAKKIEIRDALRILRNLMANQTQSVAPAAASSSSASQNYFNINRFEETSSLNLSTSATKSILHYKCDFKAMNMIAECFGTTENLSNDESIIFLQKLNLILDNESCHSLINALFTILIQDPTECSNFYYIYQSASNKKTFLMNFLENGMGHVTYEIIFKKLRTLVKKFKNADALDFLMDVQHNQIQLLARVCLAQKRELKQRPDSVENIARVLGQANKQKVAPITTLPVELLTNICTLFAKPYKEQQAQTCARSIIENNGRSASSLYQT